MKKLVLLLPMVMLSFLEGCGGNSNNVAGRTVLQSLQISPDSSTIPAGQAQQFTAIGKYSDGTSKDLTTSATWSSSSPNVTFSHAGLATSKTPGTAAITATLGSVSGTSTLSVAAPALVSLGLTPANPSVAAGVAEQFTALGNYSDGSSKDLTRSVTWTSSNTGVVTISASGLAMSKAQGTSRITATSASVSSATTLTVMAATLASIAVTPPNASIAASTTAQFTATGTFTDGSTLNITNLVTWSSSATSLASISNAIPTQGLVNGVAPGSVTITATNGTISGSANLIVTTAVLNSIAVTPASASIPLGVLQQFTATGTFSDGTTQDISTTVTWSSSDIRLASITVGGVAAAGSLGTVTITAASGSVTGSTSLNINAANLSSIAILPGSPTIAQDTSQQFSALGTFDDGGTRNLTNQVAWSSSNPAVATIGSGSGITKALSPGTTTITGTLGPATSSATLNVSNATILSISVTPTGRAIAPGTKLGFTATGKFSDSSTQIITNDVGWVSDNQAVATVGNSGVATSVGPGTANISAIFGSVTGSAPLNVSSATLDSIAVTPRTALLAPASTLGYQATGTFSDGTTQNITNVVAWSSSASNVVTINPGGQVTAQSAGSATITAQLGSVSNTADLLVESSALTSITIAPAITTVATQIASQFTATGAFQDNSIQNLTNSVTWTCSPASVATISDLPGKKGLAMGVSPGTATVTAVFAGAVGTASLSVSDATLTSITVSPSGPNVSLGTSQRFIATGTFSDGSTLNLTNQATWSSSNVVVAIVNAGGVATSAAIGMTTISATLNGVSGTASLTVY